jgi:hypothetical protein
LTLPNVRAARRRKCVCQVADGYRGHPEACSIVLEAPGESLSRLCPDCGRERIIVSLGFDPGEIVG